MESILTAQTVAIVAACVSGLFAVLAARSNAKGQLKVQARARKEDQYYRMIDALVKLKSGKGDEGELSSLIQQVYLVGSADVVRALNSYLEILTGDTGKSRSEQEKLYSALLKAMRIDLYGRRRSCGFPDKVALAIFDKERERIPLTGLDAGASVGRLSTATSPGGFQRRSAR